MKVKEFKLKIHEIQFWVLVFRKDIWTWIGVMLDVVNFTKDYCNNIILMVQKFKWYQPTTQVQKTLTIKKIWNLKKFKIQRTFQKF
jgi:hypothetical protein